MFNILELEKWKTYTVSNISKEFQKYLKTSKNQIIQNHPKAKNIPKKSKNIQKYPKIIPIYPHNATIGYVWLRIDMPRVFVFDEVVRIPHHSVETIWHGFMAAVCRWRHSVLQRSTVVDKEIATKNVPQWACHLPARVLARMTSALKTLQGRTPNTPETRSYFKGRRKHRTDMNRLYHLLHSLKWSKMEVHEIVRKKQKTSKNNEKQWRNMKNILR